MYGYPILCLLLPVFIKDCFGDDLTYVSGYFSKTPQKLSKYSWYGNVRLYHFRVPEDTVLVRWLLTVTKGSGSNCGNHNITIHFRSGAPPVINPINTEFANNTAFLPAQNLSLSINSGQNITLFNVSNPAPGDWFVAAHLPKDDGRIEHKGFSSSCSYFFQPQMFVRRAVDMPILEFRSELHRTVSSPDNPAVLKVFLPEYTSELAVRISGCDTEGLNAAECPLLLTLGSATLRRSTVRTVNCTGRASCTITLRVPPWETWIRVTVESIYVNVTTDFTISANHTVGCKPKSVGLTGDFFTRVSANSSGLLGGNISVAVGNASAPGNSSLSPDVLDNACVHNQPVFREELDVVSVRFAVINGPNTNVTHGNATVFACLTARSPVLALNRTQTCATALSQGYDLRLNVTSPQAVLRIPFPEVAMWYLTLQMVCPDNTSDCTNASATVMTSAYLSACIDDCGTYGECRLLRSYSYLYAACVCKAGWRGWSCTDNLTAQTYSRQMAAALLLTLSNLLFIPPIVVAVYRCYIVEASVYLFTMFFSTFYHACDQPGVTVLCIMDYDTLQYCDFLGSVSSIWVTILCMSRVKETFKYVSLRSEEATAAGGFQFCCFQSRWRDVTFCLFTQMLFMLGTLIIAMSMQLDRRGLWNMLGPILCAVLAMVAAWVYRGVKRRQCYPTTWKRWVFYLIPGLASAIIGLSVYVFTETDDNYYYTHSIWHVMVASSVVFLLPPRDRHQEPWGWSQKLCGYQICKNEKEELYAVT
ncbi:hypothetical protein JZ751_028398 [Albula glossodonta]|uniref:EGF-like domain-containing protein n=1 Tax=Albula glossodonta TaxID=121402 RepID=A0A8T2NE94_9TELE|nr:hypothetical protein JZ751_028398 [Albula glossodonta]